MLTSSGPLLPQSVHQTFLGRLTAAAESRGCKTSYKYFKTATSDRPPLSRWRPRVTMPPVDFDQLIQTRYSVRAYRSDPVPDELLQRVLRAGILAPTACNRQPFRIIVIQTAPRREELSRLYPRGPWLVEAPLVLAVVGVLGEAWVRRSDGLNHYLVDAAIVMDHMVLAATEAGLGTCWVCAFDPAVARQTLALPEGVQPVAFTPLGHPSGASTAPPRVRRPLEELVMLERWRS